MKFTALPTIRISSKSQSVRDSTEKRKERNFLQWCV